MSETVYVFVIAIVSTFLCIQADVNIDSDLINCFLELNQTCMESQLRDTIRDTMSKNEISINGYISIERIDDNEISNNVFREFLRNHALKVKISKDLVGRIFESRTIPVALEVTVDSYKDGIGSGRGDKVFGQVVPLMTGFKTAKVIMFSLLAIKFFLLKSVVLSNVSLMVASIILGEKGYEYLLDYMLKHHNNYVPEGAAVYKKNEMDFSGYGFNMVSSDHQELSGFIVPPLPKHNADPHKEPLRHGSGAYPVLTTSTPHKTGWIRRYIG